MPEHIGSIRYGMSGSTLFMEASDGSRYAIRPDLGITITPSHGRKREEIAQLIESIAIPALASMRGVALFHGSAVERDGRGLVFLGERGTGKSTMAARLALSGWGMLCDDVVAIIPGGKRDGKPLVATGIPRPRLLSAATNPSPGPRGGEKHELEVPTGKGPAPLEAIYILAIGDRQSVCELKGSDKLREILCHPMNLPGLEKPSATFERYVRFLHDMPAIKLTRQRIGDGGLTPGLTRGQTPFVNFQIVLAK
jgi:hypothetical protein